MTDWITIVLGGAALLWLIVLPLVILAIWG